MIRASLLTRPGYSVNQLAQSSFYRHLYGGIFASCNDDEERRGLVKYSGEIFSDARQADWKKPQSRIS